MAKIKLNNIKQQFHNQIKDELTHVSIAITTLTLDESYTNIQGVFNSLAGRDQLFPLVNMANNTSMTTTNKVADNNELFFSVKRNVTPNTIALFKEVTTNSYKLLARIPLSIASKSVDSVIPINKIELRIEGDE